ncbi:MAG: hypothetical protein COV67_05355 [Nitrospinae bacterium CG11_big_fil_rev_8_21_14_0_20_56_8]|nr:MAG: hypothetical protein COV67_05355 [Nitrospinae bacterium CG11_big_fil_rev_8_21_14_0_20_56_8]
MRKMAISFLTVFAFLAFISIASANVSTVPAGGSTICENASWLVDNLSDDQETTIQFDIGPHAYVWEKTYTQVLEPGGFRANAIAAKTKVTNKGPGAISVNCQHKRADSHDWKVDAGSQKTYQTNYHMDHVVPSTYIEPGLGQPQGTERSLFSQGGGASGGAIPEINR